MTSAILLAALLCPVVAAAQSAPDRGRAAAEIVTQEDRIPENALPGSQTGLMGRKVDEIRMVSLRDLHEMLSRIPLKTGDRLERDKLRASVRQLYESGRFAEIEVDATPSPAGGVVVEFRTKPNYFNGNATVTGLAKTGVNETEVLNTGRLELGALFSDELLKDSESRILRMLHDSGYWKAQVGANLNPHKDTQQIDVVFQVVVGPSARIGELAVTGDPELSDEEAAKICKLHPGMRARGNLLQRAVTRLRKRYVQQHRLRAQITSEAPVYHSESNTVDYRIEVQRGPIVDISAEGMKLSRSKLKRYVPVYEEHAVDEDLLNEGRRKLRDYLQGLGYFDAVVQVQQDEDTVHGRQHIVYQIHPGQQHRLVAIEFQGNKRFDTATLHERMTTQVSTMLQPHGRYSQALVSADLDSIRTLYRSNGYESVKVSSEVIDDFEDARGDMKLVFKVQEGPLVRVGKLEISGARAVSETEIRGLINTQAGQPFSDATVGDDREVVLNDYFNRGFPSVQLETTAKYADENHTLMDVVYDIHEGPQEFVNRVLVSGVENTKPHIVKRAVAIHEGMPLSQEKMLQTQRNLYDLGIFTEVQTAIQNPEGDERDKDVLFQIQEARRWTVNYGFGLEIGTGLNTAQGGSSQGQTGVSPRVTLEVTRINFRGRDQSLIFKSHFGTLEKRASMSFDQPRWFDLPNWRLTLTALYDNERDVNTFSSSREEGALQLTERATKSTQLLYRFSYRRIQVDPDSFPAGFSPDLIPIYSRPVRVGMPSITYLRDTRDDPVNSTKGTYNTFDIGVASSYFGSQTDFGRVLAQNATYYKFWHNWVFARSLRIGVESPFGNFGDVPLPERYFVGGSNSHRGFAINQAGPRDSFSGAPLGGDAMIVNNLELRLPPAPLPYVENNVSFVLFHDIGNDFATANEMWKNLARMNQRNQQSCRDLSAAATCDFSYMSQAVGTGVRYKTPIGPVRVDLGYDLNPPWFPAKDPCAGVKGNCTAQPYYEQVRHFNFYFSIGQTF